MRVYVSASSCDDGELYLSVADRLASLGAEMLRSDAEADRAGNGDPPCSLTSLISDRIASADMFMLLVSEDADTLASSICRTCGYNKGNKCVMLSCNHELADKSSFCELECLTAVKLGKPIAVVYRTVVNKSKCPAIVRSRGTHTSIPALTELFGDATSG